MPGTILTEDWRSSVEDQLHQAADDAIARARAAQQTTIAPVQQAVQTVAAPIQQTQQQVADQLHGYVDQLGQQAQQAAPAVIQLGQNAQNAVQDAGAQVLGGAQQATTAALGGAQDAQAQVSDALHQHVNNLLSIGGGAPPVTAINQPPTLGGPQQSNKPTITTLGGGGGDQSTVTTLGGSQSSGAGGSGDGAASTDTSGGPNTPIDASSPGAFARSMAPYAQYAAQKLGIDPTWVAAMAASESNYGKADAAGHELFGVKALPGQPGTTLMTHEGENGGTNMNQSFAAYDSAKSAVDAWVDLIQNHYKGAVNAQDLPTFIHGLKAGGYFTAGEGEYLNIVKGIGDKIGGDVQAVLNQPGKPTVATTPPVTTAQARAADLGYKDISQLPQYNPELTSDEAYSACGPAAAVRFAEKFGRNPTLREATDLAKQVGWTSGGGMAGISSEQKLMSNLGIDTKIVGRDWAAYAQEAQTGNPVTISTPGHYYFADGYNPESGAFHVGRSGLDLKGGSEWMTPAQMENLMGQAQGALFANNPTVPNRGNTTTSNASVNAPDQPVAKAPIVMGGMQDANGQPTAQGYQGPSLIQTAQDAAGDVLGGVGSAVGGAASALGGAAQGAVQGAQQGAVQVAPILGGAASAAGSTVRSVADDLGQATQGAVNQVEDLNRQTPGTAVVNAAAPVLGGAASDLGTQTRNVADTAGQTLGGAATTVDQVRQQVQDAVDGLPANATVAQVKQVIADTLGTLGPQAQNLASTAGDLATGGITRRFNENLREVGQDVLGATGNQPVDPSQGIKPLTSGAASALESVAQNVPANVPVLAGALGIGAALLRQPGVLDSLQTMQQLNDKYADSPGAQTIRDRNGQPIVLQVDPSVMTPAERAAYTAATAVIGSITGPTDEGGAQTNFRAPTTVGGTGPIDINPPRRLAAPGAGTSADRLDYLLDRGRYAPAEEPPIPRSPSSGERPLATTVAGEGPLNVASSAGPLDINPSGRRLTDVPSGTPADQLDALLERGRHAPPEERPTPTMLERANTVRLAGLLSSTTTHLVNATGNLVNGATAIPQQVIASGFDAARVGLRGGSRQRYLGEVLPMIKSWGPGVISSVPDALEILRTGVSPQTAGKLDHIGAGFRSDLLPVVGRMLGTKGGAIADSAIEMPLRMLQASDVLFRGGATNAFTNSLATRKALQEGFKGPALQQRVGAIMANLERHPELVKEANDQAARIVFQEQRQVPFIGRQAGKALEGSGALRFVESQVLPFTKTPANITAQGMGLSPLGWASVADAARSGNPGLALDRAARASLGTAAFGVATWMGAHGLLTGAYPDDPNVRSTLPNGWREWSVRLPQSDGSAIYVPMQNFGAYGWPMAMAAIATDASSQGKPMDPDQVGKAVTSMGRYVLDNTFLQGLSDATNALHDPERYGQKLLESEASSFVPYSGMGRQLENMSGMVNRNPREGMQGILDAMAATNPLTAGTVPARTNALGDTVSPTVTGAAAGVLPLRTTVEQDDPTLKVLRDNGVGVTNIASAVNVPSGSVKLTEAEQEDFKKARGDLIKRYVASETRSPEFAAARTVTARNKYLSDAVQRANRDARETMINKWAADRDTWRARVEKKAVPEPYYLGGTEGP